MLNPWVLPDRAVFDGKEYVINADFRDILDIFSYFDDPDLPEYIRWEIALALFYREPIPLRYRQEAMAYLCSFINCGKEEQSVPSAKLLDWQQDAQTIVADVNKVAGCEIRTMPFLHWWTFMAWFNAIGQGQLSTVVSIRDKLRRGQALEKWEKEFYRANRPLVDMKKRYSREELEERSRLQQLLEPKQEVIA